MKKTAKPPASRRAILKSVGVMGGLSVGSVRPAEASMEDRIRFIEYSVFGNVQNNDDFVSYNTNRHSAHQIISSDEIVVDKRLLSDKDIEMFRREPAIVWGEEYTSLPMVHSKNDLYLLSNEDHTVGAIPVIDYGQHQGQSPVVNLENSSKGVKISAQGNSKEVPDGNRRNLNLQPHSANIPKYRGDVEQVPVIPTVSIQNFGELRIRWME